MVKLFLKLVSFSDKIYSLYCVSTFYLNLRYLQLLARCRVRQL